MPEYSIPCPPKKNAEYVSKSDIKDIAQGVVDSLRPQGLPIWQVKEILREAMKLVDWEKLK